MPTDKKSKVLLVDDEVENLNALQRTLRGPFELVSCSTPFEALEKLKSDTYAVIMSDQRMPGMQGTDLLAEAAKISPLTTRLILTAFTDTREILDAINRAEIYRYITKPWENTELVAALRNAVERYELRRENEQLVEALKAKNEALTLKEKELLALNQNLETQVEQRTRELTRANERLSELALVDPLTKIANRRALFQRFQEEIDRADRYHRPLTVALVDVDHFKDFNDMEGHVCGDEALKKIAAILASNLRKTDFLGRYGGEEFLVIMPETPVANALEISTRLRLAIENTQYQGKTQGAYLTISLGLATHPTNGESSKVLVEAADRALYEAKQSGRNRIVVAT